MPTYNELGDFNTIQQEINEWTIPAVSKAQIEPMEMIKKNAGYAVEQHQWNNYHMLAEMAPNKEMRELFSRITFEEEEHQALMGSLEDPETTPMEASLALEMTAIQGFADAAQLEPNETCKTVYDYIMLDHLTQTKALSDMASKMGMSPENIVKGHIEIMEGRPFNRQFVQTGDLFKQPLDKNTADMMSFVNLHTLIANEMMLRNGFQMQRRMLASQDARRLYNMVTAVENIHVTMLESLHDPMITPLEYAMINELMEIRTHRLGMQMSKSDSAKQAHEYALKEDEQHLSWLRDAYTRIEGGDSAKYAPVDKLFAMPQMSAMEYINQIIQTQINLQPKGVGFQKAA